MSANYPDHLQVPIAVHNAHVAVQELDQKLEEALDALAVAEKNWPEFVAWSKAEHEKWLKEQEEDTLQAVEVDETVDTVNVPEVPVDSVDPPNAPEEEVEASGVADAESEGLPVA